MERRGQGRGVFCERLFLLGLFPGVDDSDGEVCEIFGVSRGEGASFGCGDSCNLSISHIHRDALAAAVGGNFPRR